MSENNNKPAETVEGKKSYEFRRLNSEDIFLMVNIISKIGIREFKGIFGDAEMQRSFAAIMESGEKANNTSVYAAFGVAMLPIVDVLLGNLNKCKDDIFSLLAQVSGVEVDKLKKMDGVTFLEMVIDFVKKPEFPDFFKVVSKLFK